MSNQDPSQTEDNNQFDINESSYKTTHTAVRKARRFALQGLYEWLMTDHRFEQSGKGEWKANPPHDIAARTRATNAMHTVHLGYYHEMMRHIPQQIDELDALIIQHLDRSIDKIDRVEHAILLIGAYELKHSLHIPYKVVLDEAMKLNTHFGATDAHKLINAVMDKLAAQLRDAEMQAHADTSVSSASTAAKKSQNTDLSANNFTTKDSSTKDSSTKDSSTKDSSTKDSSTKDSHVKESTEHTPPKPRLSRQGLVGAANQQPANQSNVNSASANPSSATTND